MAVGGPMLPFGGRLPSGVRGRLRGQDAARCCRSVAGCRPACGAACVGRWWGGAFSGPRSRAGHRRRPRWPRQHRPLVPATAATANGPCARTPPPPAPATHAACQQAQHHRRRASVVAGPYGVRGCDRRDHSGSPRRWHEKKVLRRQRWRSASARPGVWTGERTPGPRAPRTRHRTPGLRTPDGSRPPNRSNGPPAAIRQPPFHASRVTRSAMCY